MRKKLYSSIVAFAVFCSMLFGGAAPVRAFDAEYLNGEGMELGYSIINGYSKLSAREGLCSFEKAAVYCGLDVTNPYILSLGLMYYLTHGVDLDKAMTDNGFKPLPEEWWHFTLKDEPYPDTYFTFPINSEALAQ